MVEVVIGIGSNCGDRQKNVSEAIEWLKSRLMQIRCSEIYETPCAVKGDSTYMNAVVKGYYQGTGFELDDLLKEKEREMGRDARCREEGKVPIDMDIVIMDGEVVKPWDYRQKFFRLGYSQLS